MTIQNNNDFSIFNKKQQELISQYGFKNMEHLAAYAHDEVCELRLSELLSLSSDKLTQLLKPFTTSPDTIQFSSDLAKKHSLGLKQFTQSNTKGHKLTNWKAATQLPEKFSLKKESTKFGIPNQTMFPSCVAMAHGLTAQVLFDNDVEFSKYFYYWLLKYVQGDNEPGSCAYYALDVSENWGHCPEFMLPFSSWEESHTDFQALPEPLLIKAAKKYQLNNGYYTNDPTISVNLIKSMLCGANGVKPRLVPIGVPLFTSFNNYYTWLTGEVNEPLPGEKTTGYHDMTAIGYCDDESYPGGGYFIVQNSWGESWAKESVEGAGICRISYNYMHQYAEEVTIMLLKSESLPAINTEQNDVESPQVADEEVAIKHKETQSIHLGVNEQKQDIYWNEEDVPNQNMLIVGSCGETKSNTVKQWITQHKKNKSTEHHVVFDMHGEYGNFSDASHSKNFKTNYINIADIGLPFQLLKVNQNLPIDIQTEAFIGMLKSVMPQLGTNQQNDLRVVIKRGYHEQWSNTELREQLERNLEDTTKSQVYPFLLLLRSDGESLSDYLDNQMTVFDLSAFQDFRSRAAFVVLTTSQLFHHQSQQFKEHGANNFGSIRLWFEEASTIKGAKTQLLMLFQQARKFKLASVYITQVLLDIPTFITRNCATQILFRTAVKDHPELKNKMLPSKLGEALVRIDINDILVQIPLCDIGNKNSKQPLQKVVNFAKNNVTPANAMKQPTNLRYLPTMMLNTNDSILSKALSVFNRKGNKSNNSENKSHHLCFAFKTGKHQILMDGKTGALVTQLTPYKTLLNWKNLLHHLPDIIDINALKKLNNQQGLALTATGLFSFNESGLGIIPQLKTPPRLAVNKVSKLVDPNTACLEKTQSLTESKLRDFRMVCSALWKITLPDEVRPILIMTVK